MIQGYYALDTKKKLSYHPGNDSIIAIREDGDFIASWAWDGSRSSAWEVLIEAKSLGADKERIDELAAKWKCDNQDAFNYALFLDVKLGMDGNAYTATRNDFTNLQESPCGFGDSYLDAMAQLATQLGYNGGKMWNNHLKDLTKLIPG